jgi:hypothetical protein
MASTAPSIPHSTLRVAVLFISRNRYFCPTLSYVSVNNKSPSGTMGMREMKNTQPEDDGWEAAQAALAAAQNLPAGSERLTALRKAGQLRFEADEKRRMRERDEQAPKA